ncbi:hypothetical protein FPX27_22095 [Salmonella enterica]|nr:hypothetical protein [Salmonella enterica]
MATDAQIKQINALIKKYPDSCSICQQDYDEDYVTYTVFGYDKNRKMQVRGLKPNRTKTYAKYVF